MRLGFAAMLRVRVSALGKVNSIIMMMMILLIIYNCCEIKLLLLKQSHRNSIDDQKKDYPRTYIIMGQTNSTADGSTEQQWDIDSTPVELVLQVCGAADLRPH